MSEIDFSLIKQARYIKLGKQGCWESLCFKEGTLRLGFYEVPNNSEHNADAIRDIYLKLNYSKNLASRYARQVTEFNNAGPETLWITFSKGRVWWCVAERKISFISNDPITHPQGSRFKRASGTGWNDCSLSGKPLEISKLSGQLTKSAGFRSTICRISEESFQYLVLKIFDQALPLLLQTKSNKAALLENIIHLIQALTWKDFEIFVSLLFEGWRRVSSIGGKQKTIDIVYENPMTLESVGVQVKSTATQKELNDCFDALDAMQHDHIFYIYHTAKGSIQPPTTKKNFHLLGPVELAEKALKMGLLDWLMEKAI